MTWQQRTEHRALGDSDTTEYRFCLDALIATIEDMKSGYLEIPWNKRYLLWAHVRDAEARAAELAHWLFEKWIEVRPPCYCETNGPFRVPSRGFVCPRHGRSYL